MTQQLIPNGLRLTAFRIQLNSCNWDTAFQDHSRAGIYLANLCILAVHCLLPAKNLRALFVEFRCSVMCLTVKAQGLIWGWLWVALPASAAVTLPDAIGPLRDPTAATGLHYHIVPLWRMQTEPLLSMSRNRRAFAHNSHRRNQRNNMLVTNAEWQSAYAHPARAHSRGLTLFISMHYIPTFVSYPNNSTAKRKVEWSEKNSVRMTNNWRFSATSCQFKMIDVIST